MPRVRRLNGRAIALSLLLVLTALVLYTSTPCIAANLSEKYQFDSNIELVAPLASEMRIEDVKIQNVLNISYTCINNENFDAQKTIFEGQVAWKPENLTIQSATIIDSAGDTIPFLNYSGTIMNPELNRILPAHSNYTLSLIVIMMPGASYSSQLQAWQFGTSLNSSKPIQASITFPSDFSTPFFTPGAECTKDQGHKVYTWHNSPSSMMLNLSVVFLPFPYNPETIRLGFSADISSVFPVLVESRGTITHEFKFPSSYNGLAVPPIFQFAVPFPLGSSDTLVVSVYDIGGPCTSLPDYLSEINYTNSGTYYADYKNRIVTVYPRTEIGEEYYHYIVYVLFDIGKVPSDATFGLLWPYEKGYRSNISLATSGDWKITLAQNTMVEFLLPQGSNPYESRDYRIYPDEVGRYLIRFVNNSSEWTTGVWEIRFYVVRLFNFFWIEVASIALLFGLLVVMFFLRTRQLGSMARKTISYYVPSITGPGFIALEYATAGDWFLNIIAGNWIFTLLLFSQVALTVIAYVAAQMWKFDQQTC